MNKLCAYCAESIYEDALFCHACGKRQPQNENNSQIENTNCIESNREDETRTDHGITNETAVSKPKKLIDKNFIITLIRNSILLIVAITVFALSFAPVFSLKMQNKISDDYTVIDFDYKVNFSAIDGMVFMFDSFRSLDEEDITDSKLFEDLEELGEEFLGEDLDDSSGILAKCAKISYRLYLQSEECNTNLAIVLTAVISLLYVLFALAFLSVSIFNFIATFGKFTSKKDKISRATITMLAAVPSLAFIVYNSFFVFIKIPNVFNIINFFGKSSVKYAMGSGTIATLIISSTAIAAITVLAFISRLHKTKSNIIKRAISATLALLVICMCFAPIATTSIRTVFEGKDKKSTANITLYSSTFANYFLSESEKEILEDKLDSLYYIDDYEEMFEEEFSLFSQYRVKDVKKGYADAENNNFHLLLNSVGSTYLIIPDFIALVSIFFLIISITAGMVLQQNLIYFMSGKYSKIQLKTGKIVSLVFACIALAAVIAFVIMVCAFADFYSIRGYSLSIGAGIILLAIFAIANCCIPSKIKE